MTILPTQCCPPDKASLQSHLPCISTEQVKFCTITVQSLGEHNRSEMIICFLTHRSNTGTRFTLSIFLFIYFKQGSFWWTSNCVLVILLLNTAETIFEDHSNNQAKVLLKQVWSLLKGSLTWKYDGKGVPKNGFERGVVLGEAFIYMEIRRERFQKKWPWKRSGTRWGGPLHGNMMGKVSEKNGLEKEVVLGEAVSYTHLTLPTKLSV